MGFNARKFCSDFKIGYARSGKHKRAGWINVQCPFCAGHAGFHLGMNIDEGYSVCHRCGYHHLDKVISVLAHVNFQMANDIRKEYSSGIGQVREQKRHIQRPSSIEFPPGIRSLTDKARNYLDARKYDADKLVRDWGLLSTAHWGFYKNRILAPIYINNQVVSYQCRDITGKHDQKYLACFQEEEITEHQKCVYGFDSVVGRKCIVVEGITDVWRLGHGAIATFGISFTKQQARMIAINFDRVFIMYDSETQAQEKADELAFLIGSSFKNPVEVVNLPFIVEEMDPGDLLQDDANNLMKEIGL